MGKEVLHKNINSIREFAIIVKELYGPCGLNKIIQRENNSFKIFIDSASLLEELSNSAKYRNNLELYPILELLLQSVLTLKDEVGDGSTSVVILSFALLKRVPDLLNKGLHPHSIITSLRKVLTELNSVISKKLSFQLEYENISSILPQVLSPFLSKNTSNSLDSNSILDIITKASRIQNSSKMSNIHIVTIPGGSLTDTQVINGVAFETTFNYAGNEQQPKYLENPILLLLDYELELKHMGESTIIDINLHSNLNTSPRTNEYTRFIDTEWNIFSRKLNQIKKTGCNVVLSSKAIGDYATQFFAENNIRSCGRVEKSVISLISRASGVPVFSSIEIIGDYIEQNIKVCSACKLYEQLSFGNQRFEIFRSFPIQEVACILLRSSSSHLLDQAKSTITNALKLTNSLLRSQGRVVPAACATELYLSAYLSKSLEEDSQIKHHLVQELVSSALLDLPRVLLENCGIDANNIISYYNHLMETSSQTLMGVNVQIGKLEDSKKLDMYEVAEVKWKILCASIEFVCTVLSIDYVAIKQKK